MNKTKIKQQRPEKSIAEAAKELGFTKGSKKSLIDKTFTAMKAAGDGDLGSGIYTPTAEQMAKINLYTASPKSAEEIIAFDTLSCNDMVDRDDDRFVTDCVKDFAKLEGAYSPVGKSFMVSHDYTKLPVGRIFDVGTKKVEDALHLTNSVYMPNTDQYKSYAENLDFGIYWAVSVGVMLEEQTCSVCDSPMVGRFWVFCMENGHEKGLWYDPKSEEKDAWGWALPVEPGTKGAEKCIRNLASPKDFYELSQCFLGAQYDAQISRGALKGVIKAASAGNTAIVNLSREEAKEIPFQHVSEQVREAYDKGFTISTNDEGHPTWKDEHNLVWVFDPSEDEVLCLGEAKSTDDDEEVKDGKGNEGKDGSTSALGEGGTQREQDGGGQSDSEDGEGDDDEADADEEGVDDADEDEDDDSEEEESDDDSSGDDDAKSVSKTTVIAAANAARLPQDVIAAAAGASGNGLDALLRSCSKLIKDQKARVAGLETKAALGESFIESKKSEAIAMYVRAHQSGERKAVNVDRFKKKLERMGEDIELIQEEIEEQKAHAQAKFPATVRRSTAEADVNERNEVGQMEAPVSKESAEKVRSLHG